MKIVILNSTDGQFYFVIKARNGQVLVTSETYKRKASCKKCIQKIQHQLYFKTPIVDHAK